MKKKVTIKKNMSIAQIASIILAVFDYTDIVGKARRAYNVGGGVQEVYFIPRADCTSIPRPLDLLDPAFTTPGDIILITDDITPDTLLGWRKSYAIRDSVTVKGTPSAERDASGYKMEGEFMVSNIDPDDLGNQQAMMNDDLLYLFPTPDGKYVLLGSNMFAAETKVEFDLGKNESGVRASKVKVSSFEVCPMLYEGVITMHP